MSCLLNYYPFLKLNYLRTFCKMEARCLNKTLEHISDLCKKFSGVLTGVLAVVLAVVLAGVLADVCLMGPACLIGPARLISPARLTILKKNSLPARLTEPARLTIFRKKSTLLA